MKSLIFSILIMAFVGQNTVFGQAKYEMAVAKLVAAVDTAKNEQDFITLANGFNRISKASPDNWEAYYNNAYCNLIAGFITMGKDMAKAQLLADEAMASVNAGKEKATDPKAMSEFAALEAYILIAKVNEDPMAKGAALSEKIHGLLGKAMAMSANPRASYIKGLYVLNTPEFYGGGATNALPHLKQADSLFQAYESPILLINWGKKDNDALLEKLASK